MKNCVTATWRPSARFDADGTRLERTIRAYGADDLLGTVGALRVTSATRHETMFADIGFSWQHWTLRATLDSDHSFWHGVSIEPSYHSTLHRCTGMPGNHDHKD